MLRRLWHLHALSNKRHGINDYLMCRRQNITRIHASKTSFAYYTFA